MFQILFIFFQLQLAYADEETAMARPVETRRACIERLVSGIKADRSSSNEKITLLGEIHPDKDIESEVAKAANFYEDIFRELIKLQGGASDKKACIALEAPPGKNASDYMPYGVDAANANNLKYHSIDWARGQVDNDQVANARIIGAKRALALNEASSLSVGGMNIRDTHMHAAIEGLLKGGCSQVIAIVGAQHFDRSYDETDGFTPDRRVTSTSSISLRERTSLAELLGGSAIGLSLGNPAAECP